MLTTPIYLLHSRTLPSPSQRLPLSWPKVRRSYVAKQQQPTIRDVNFNADLPLLKNIEQLRSMKLSLHYIGEQHEYVLLH